MSKFWAILKSLAKIQALSVEVSLLLRWAIKFSRNARFEEQQWRLLRADNWSSLAFHHDIVVVQPVSAVVLFSQSDFISLSQYPVVQWRLHRDIWYLPIKKVANRCKYCNLRLQSLFYRSFFWIPAKFGVSFEWWIDYSQLPSSTKIPCHPAIIKHQLLSMWGLLSGD